MIKIFNYLAFIIMDIEIYLQNFDCCVDSIQFFEKLKYVERKSLKIFSRYFTSMTL